MKLIEFYEKMQENYEVVLKRMMGNEEFLYMLLDKFVASRDIEEFEMAICTHDASKIFEQAHTLKGVSENLGLKPLYEKLSIIVEITRKGSVEGIDEVLVQIKQIYVEIIKMLEDVTIDE